MDFFVEVLKNVFMSEELWKNIAVVVVPVVFQEVMKRLKLRNEKAYNTALRYVRAGYIAIELSQTGEKGLGKFKILMDSLNKNVVGGESTDKKVSKLLEKPENLLDMVDVVKGEADKQLSYPGIQNIMNDKDSGFIEGYLEGVYNEITGSEVRGGIRGGVKF